MQGRKPSQDLMGSSAAMSGKMSNGREWNRGVHALLSRVIGMPETTHLSSFQQCTLALVKVIFHFQEFNF